MSCISYYLVLGLHIVQRGFFVGKRNGRCPLVCYIWAKTTSSKTSEKAPLRKCLELLNYLSIMAPSMHASHEGGGGPITLVSVVSAWSHYWHDNYYPDLGHMGPAPLLRLPIDQPPSLTTLVGLISVGYHSELCVALTFYGHCLFSPTMLYRIRWCAY